MPRFYTHVLHRTGYAKDAEGQELAGLDEACEGARRSALGMVASEIEIGRYPVELEYHIHDETGQRIATLPVTATVSGIY